MRRRRRRRQTTTHTRPQGAAPFFLFPVDVLLVNRDALFRQRRACFGQTPLSPAGEQRVFPCRFEEQGIGVGEAASRLHLAQAQRKTSKHEGEKKIYESSFHSLKKERGRKKNSFFPSRAMRLGALAGPSAPCSSSLARTVASRPPASSFATAPGRRRAGSKGGRSTTTTTTTPPLAMPSPSPAAAAAAASPDYDPFGSEDESSTASLVADAVTWASTHGMVRSEGETFFSFSPGRSTPRVLSHNSRPFL